MFTFLGLLLSLSIASVNGFRAFTSIPKLASSSQMRISETQLFQSSEPAASTSTTTTLSSPPRTFLDCVKQAVTAAKKAIAGGDLLMEVEFPPLPLEVLEDSSSSARDIADANTRWAIEFAKSFSSQGPVTILYPDQPEVDDALKYVDMGGGNSPFPNITLTTARTDSIKNSQSLDQILGSIFGATIGGTVQAIEGTKLYVIIISSAQELPDIEKLHNLSPDVPIVLFNLRLDVLRGDLGLPLFPGRDLHHRFLSKVRPVYLMRSRAFATSLRKPPFILNYSGLLFRVYPEGFQAILNTGKGNSRSVAVTKERPSNMDYRDSLVAALKVPGLSVEELKAPGNLVWWEKETDKESSSNWRS